MKHRATIGAILLCFLLMSVGSIVAQGEKLHVLATTTIIADVARNVGGDLVEVESLIPPDADVHAFEPAPDDIVKVAEADILLVNGAGLESFLGTLLENAGGVEPVVVSNGVAMLPFGEHGHEEGDEARSEEEHAVGEVIGVLSEDGVCEGAHEHESEAEHEEGEEDHEHGACDPHVWTDPKNVMIWVDNIAEAFADAAPNNAETYRANAEAYKAELESLDTEVSEILTVIPADKRILVTNHEFLGYFAHAYGFEVVGVVIGGGGTLSEPDPRELAALIDVITEEQVTAIFVEVSANPGLAETIASETGIDVVTTIYSDSLSKANGPAATYLDYLRYNARTIAQALAD